MIKTLILINPIKDNNNLKRERCKPQYWRQLLASKNSGTQFKQPCMHHCTSCSTGRQMQIQGFSRPTPFPHISVSSFNHNHLSPQFLMSKSIYYKNRKKMEKLDQCKERVHLLQTPNANHFTNEISIQHIVVANYKINRCKGSKYLITQFYLTKMPQHISQSIIKCRCC